MRVPFFFVATLLTIVVSSADKVRYENYQVLRIFPQKIRDATALKVLEDLDQVTVFSSIKKDKPVDILVSPENRESVKGFLSKKGIKYEVFFDDLSKLIIEEEKRLSKIPQPRVYDWKDYHPLEEVYAWLDELEKNNNNVKKVVGGQTYEGRDIRGIEINFGEGLPGVVIESNIHAREWITIAASSWIVNEILKSKENSTWRQFNYLYFPTVNPDGYVYTWEKERLWRKTRTPYKYQSRTCYGSDPNRNYGSHWGEGGSDTVNPCSDIYAGPKSFSELETQSLSEYLKKAAVPRKNDIYIAYHSYSQLLMFPWGYTGEHTPSQDLWQRIGDLAAASLYNVHNTRFDVGSIYDTIYQTSGTSTEWYYDRLNATLSYVYEMRDTGRYGFELPPDQIIPVGEEHLASLLTILTEYQKLKIAQKKKSSIS